MEGQSHQNVWASLAFDGNTYDLPQLVENYPYQNYIAGGRNESHYVPLPQWTQCYPMAHNYFQFLAENGPSEIQGETLYNNSSGTCFVNPANCSLDINDQKVRYLTINDERAPIYNHTSAEQQINVQVEESKDGPYGGSQLYSRLPVGASASPPKARSRVSRQRAAAADRRRNMRIDERLAALQDLLPCTKQGGRVSILDEVINYIKYLQLQIKDLSRSRVGGEATPYPFVFLEGHGHHFLHDEMQKEPLEETIGKLMEVNPTAATQLFGSRGLVPMPIALAEGLHEQNR